MADDNSKHGEGGFEYQGVFYRWSLTDGGKDLTLIDRMTGLPAPEFFAMAEDEHERQRTPVLMTMIATSIRNQNPDWSVERIHRMVMDIKSLSADVEFIGGEAEEDPRPPDGAAREAASASTPTSDDSSSSSTPEETLPTSEMLSAIPR